MNQPANALQLSNQDREQLKSWLRAHNTPQALRGGHKSFCMLRKAFPNTRIAEEVGVTVVTVREWRKRFECKGNDSLTEIKPGRGRKREKSAAEVKRIVHDKLYAKPRGATHWSCRTMSDRHKVSSATAKDLGCPWITADDGHRFPIRTLNRKPTEHYVRRR